MIDHVYIYIRARTRVHIVYARILPVPDRARLHSDIGQRENYECTSSMSKRPPPKPVPRKPGKRTQPEPWPQGLVVGHARVSECVCVCVCVCVCARGNSTQQPLASLQPLVTMISLHCVLYSYGYWLINHPDIGCPNILQVMLKW